MENRRLYKAECIHRLGTPEYERLKVAALNLFHPTAPPLQRAGKPCTTRGAGQCPEPYMVQGVGVGLIRCLFSYGAASNLDS